MGKLLEKEQVLKKLQDSLEELKKEIENLLETEEYHKKKKANILTLWLSDYIKYFKSEKSFVPKSLPKYERGNIVLVNFGFRIGNELGGKHFAIVLDNNNNRENGLITVLPLTSKKENSKEGRYTKFLEHDLFELLTEKYTKIVDSISKVIIKLNELKQSPGEFDITDIDSQTIFDYNSIKFNKKLNSAISLKKQIDKLKIGSIANLTQITSISKMRIVRPKSYDDVLKEIKIKPSDLDKISDGLKELYFYENK